MELAGIIISSLVVLLAAWLKWYTARDTTYDTLQKGRQDIESGNADAISVRVDRLLADKADSGSVAGKPSSEDIVGRISRL